MWEEFLHAGKIVGAFITGRLAIAAVMGGAIGFGLLSGWAAPFIALPLGAAVMARISGMQRDHRNLKLLGFYREEIGAALGKAPEYTTMDDLQRVAENNPVISEALARSENMRRVGMLVHMGATVVTLAVAALALTAVSSPLVLGIGAMIGCALTDLVAGTVADAMFGFNEPTRQDHIRGLFKQRCRGEMLRPSQVLGIFVDARPEIAARIEQAYGMPYHDLPPARQEALAGQLSEALDLPRLTRDLNQRQVKMQELAFTAYGQRSGVPRLPRPPSSRFERIRMSCKQALEHGSQKATEALHEGKELLGQKSQALQEWAEETFIHRENQNDEAPVTAMHEPPHAGPEADGKPFGFVAKHRPNGEKTFSPADILAAASSAPALPQR